MDVQRLGAASMPGRRGRGLLEQGGAQVGHGVLRWRSPENLQILTV